MQDSEAERPRASTERRIAVAAGLAGGVAAVALLAAWTERQPIVAHFVNDRLRAAHVPAHYRIVAIGPFAQRLENVRIGDPSAPDLTARSLELQIGYGFGGPYLRAIQADGVRLSARLIDGDVSLGAIDRLLPASSGAPLALPDIALNLRDAQVAFDTPSGVIGASVEGNGNLSGGFAGRVTVAAPLLAGGGCAARGVTADVRVTIAQHSPRVVGPLDLSALACPSRQLALGSGRATLDMTFAPSLDHMQGGAALAGFAGHAGVARFAGASGLVTLAGDAGRIDGTTGLTLAHVASPTATAGSVMLGGRYRYIPGATGLVFAGDLAARHVTLTNSRRQALLGSAKSLVATPLGPLAARAAGEVARLLADADADARLAVTAGGSAGAGLSIRTLALTGRDGGYVRIADGDGFGWQARDRQWRVDGRIMTGGGLLPRLDVRLRQSVAGAPVDGIARLDPYAAAGGARLTMRPLAFRSTGTMTRFATVIAVDGPLGSGRVEGLTVPLAGHVDMQGGFAIGVGCVPLGFRALSVGSIALNASRVGLCGKGGGALLSRLAGGALRYGATIADLRLDGRSGAAPLAIAAARVDISGQGVALRQLGLEIGQGDAVTRFDADNIDGTIDHGALGGAFSGARARIAHVPLKLTDLGGRWTVARGALKLAGGITVADAAELPRFEPLVAHDAVLRFANGRIDATAGLREPGSGALVSNVVIRHDLASGTGGATLDVPGLHFLPNGLQPEALTPLTLGVIANTAGTVAGQGRIDWNAEGVSSSGAFHTDGIDLAAAFGPVSRIVGAITFTDLLGLVTPPHQEATIAEINPGVAVSNGVVHYQLVAGQKVQVEDARWPFAGGELILDPSLLGFDQAARRQLTFRIRGLDAAAFVQQLAFPNISATGIFDGSLPMIFDQTGGRIVGGELVARNGGGTLAYVGELSNAQLGTMGKLAFDALKAIRYSSLSIGLDGRLDGEIISSVKFDGIRQETGETSFAARMIRNLPFRFNIQIRAPFRGLMGSARAFVDPSVLLPNGVPPSAAPPTPPAAQPGAVQPVESEPVR